MFAITPLAIVLATFVSEDLTCIAVGLLAASGQLPLGSGVAACFVGIYVGDLLLWGIGRIAGRSALSWSWVERRLPQRALRMLGETLDRNLGTAVLAARFLPGTRFPLYVGAGILGCRAGAFAFWTGVAALVWVPLLVVGVALLGRTVVGPLYLILAIAWGMLFLGRVLSSPIRRAKLIAAISRLWRWEFWPTWLFYLPILPYLGWLALRYRSFTLWTSANPGITAGGVVGESKYEILRRLPSHRTIPTVFVAPGTMVARLLNVREGMEENGWSFPLILKPDASQRGAGVRRVHDMKNVESYLSGQPQAIIVQPYHPGPYEAGIFYYRFPGEAHGRIFSITDKVFPTVVGDGCATLEELIWRHPRYAMQAHVFLKRHEAEAARVLEQGEKFRLTMAGNHCQGTLFRDGSYLWTPELERTIDAIAQCHEGFYVGRFDVRYSDVEAFRAGKDLAIVELNGVTSESTNIYDPSWPLHRAYRTLMQQWAILYRIGAANRERGHEPTTLGGLLRLVGNYYRVRPVPTLAD